MIKMRTLLALLVLFFTQSLISLSTLSDLQMYASNHNEAPKSDDEFWADPDFSSYHQSLNPTFIERVKSVLGFSKKNLWDIKIFEQSLNAVVAQRKKKKLLGRTVAHVQLSYPANFIVWGNIEGSFHSLVRSLTWLHQQGIINENLEIIKSDYYLVFYGSAVNRSAYILETLTTLMILLYRNPEKVLYVRGDNEDNQYWHNFGLKRELLTRTNSQLTESTPFEKPINKFFDTLPLAFYISTIKEPLSLIRISSKGMDDPEINEELFGSFWDNPPHDTVSYYNLKRKKESSKKVTVQVIIKSENWMGENRAVNGYPSNTSGLGLLNQDRGTTAWSILSSPNMARQKYLNFDYDAFGLVNVQALIKDSSITFYNQKISELYGFKQHESVNIMTGIQNSRKNLMVKNFKIGNTLGLLGGIPGLSKQIMYGMTTCIEKANIQQEIPNIYITLISYDDSYDPLTARKNVIQLMQKDHANLILLPTGGGTLSAYIDIIKKDNGLVLFPVTGTPRFFHSSYENLIHYRPSAVYEINAIVKYIVQTKNLKKIAILYLQDTHEGRLSPGYLEAAHAALKKNGITSWVDLPYSRGATDFQQQVTLVKKELPEGIFLLSGTAFQSREFIRQLGTDNLANKVLFAVSFQAEESIQSFVRRKGLNVIFSSITPNPKKSKLPIVQAYRKEMDAKKYPYNMFSLEAYIGTNILIDALKHVKEPTTDNIKKYLESLKNYNLQGIPLSFNPKTRSLGTKVWIIPDAKEDWIEMDVSTLE